ncbi:MAG: hypothetical protein J6Y37_16695 [Paludibacteraceae bacterium]|nr:hypothetical protein [Paludibacteraceae bacterium]
MKKLFISLCATFFLSGLVSCDKEDDSADGEQNVQKEDDKDNKDSDSDNKDDGEGTNEGKNEVKRIRVHDLSPYVGKWVSSITYTGSYQEMPDGTKYSTGIWSSLTVTESGVILVFDGEPNKEYKGAFDSANGTISYSEDALEVWFVPAHGYTSDCLEIGIKPTEVGGFAYLFGAGYFYPD